MGQTVKGKAAPQRVATRIAKDLQRTLLRETGLEFKVEAPQSVNPGVDATNGYVALSNPHPKSDKPIGYLQTITSGGFTFEAGRTSIRVGVGLRDGRPSDASITAEVDNLPRLHNEPITGDVMSSIEEVLFKSRRQYGITNTSSDAYVSPPPVT